MTYFFTIIKNNEITHLRQLRQLNSSIPSGRLNHDFDIISYYIYIQSKLSPNNLPHHGFPPKKRIASRRCSTYRILTFESMQPDTVGDVEGQPPQKTHHLPRPPKRCFQHIKGTFFRNTQLYGKAKVRQMVVKHVSADIKFLRTRCFQTLPGHNKTPTFMRFRIKICASETQEPWMHL